MSIEEIRRRANTSALNQAAWTEHYRGDVKFLLAENQRLVEALERVESLTRHLQHVPQHGKIFDVVNEAIQAYKLLEKKD